MIHKGKAMKALLVTLLWTCLAQAQESTVLQYSAIADGRPPSIEEGFYDSYVTAAGFTLDVGDTLTLAVPLGSSQQVYGVAGGVGAGAVGGGGMHGSAVSSGWYTTIYNGKQAATMAKAVLAGLSGAPDPAMYMAPQSLAGAEVRVTALKLAGTKRRPYVWAECEFVNTADRENISGFITIGNVDDAVRLGEIVSPENITRDYAIQKLREAKELLDMGGYTEEQFEAEKAKYAPYVTGG
jgi:hypothetical protein